MLPPVRDTAGDTRIGCGVAAIMHVDCGTDEEFRKGQAQRGNSVVSSEESLPRGVLFYIPGVDTAMQ